jgi:REP-associated tyrosine transposase
MIGLYQGTAFSRAKCVPKRIGLQPLDMSKPTRNAHPDRIPESPRTFFATTKTSQGRSLLQSDRNASLMVEVLRCYVAARKFQLHDFVIMPDHLHVLLTVGPDMTIEKAMQLIKGGFSYRLRKECGYLGEVWQRGFSETRVMDRRSFLQHREYIAANPVKAGLADSPGEFPYCFTYLAQRKAAAAKAGNAAGRDGPTEVVP